MVPNRQAYLSIQNGALSPQSQAAQEPKTSQAPLLPMEIPAPAPPPILLVKDDSVCIGDLFSELLNDDDEDDDGDSTSPPQRGVVPADAAAQVEASEHRAYSMPGQHQHPHHHQQHQQPQQQQQPTHASMALRAPPIGLQHRQTGYMLQQKLEYPPSSITTTRLSTCGSSLPPVPHLPPPITVPPMHILRDSHAMSALSSPKTAPAPHVHGLTRGNFITAHVENDHQPNGFAETPRSTTSSCGGGNKRRRTPRSRSNSYFDDDTVNDDDCDDDDEEYDPASDDSTVGCPSVGAPMSKKITSKCGSRKHKLTEAQRIERREKNRLHAARSRMRKKKTIESLQESVEALRAENERLRDAIRLGGLVMHPVLPPVMHTRKQDPHIAHTHAHPHVYGVAM